MQQSTSNSRKARADEGRCPEDLMAMAPLACSSINMGIRLVLHQKLLLGVQIEKLWMAWDASTVLQSSSHDPIVIHQHINVSPLTGTPYPYVCFLPLSTGYDIRAQTLTLTWVKLINWKHEKVTRLNKWR